MSRTSDLKLANDCFAYTYQDLMPIMHCLLPQFVLNPFRIDKSTEPMPKFAALVLGGWLPEMKQPVSAPKEAIQ
jgi:hypothetical protein